MIETIKEQVWFALFCTLHKRSLKAQYAWQDRYLAALVRHAYKNVPLYRELLDTAGVRPTDITTRADMRNLPIMRKQTFANRMVEDYVDNSTLVQSFWYVTSGTAGTPFRFLLSEQAVTDKYIDFASLRFLWWLGWPLSRLPTTRLARIKIRGPINAYRLFVPVEHFLADTRSALERIVAFQPDVLSAYPSVLLEMLRAIERDPTLPKPAPQYILSFGEMLSDATRALVEEHFRCVVYDRYGLEEIGVVGVECAEHRGFHINTEAVAVEIVNEQGSPVAPGEAGRILATDLFNTGMPFIRYDTGDRGYISEEPCACGLRSPRIWIEGRYSAMLVFPHRAVHHLEFDGAMDGFMNSVLQYQIAKIADASLEVRVIPGPAFQDQTIERIIDNMRSLVGERVSVHVVTRTELPITPRGKSKIVVDETQVSP